VPYLRCSSCGLTTFVVRSHAWAPLCPRCDRVLSEASDADAPGKATIGETLALARELLQMDIAMVTEVAAGHEVARHLAGEWPGIGPLVGASLPLEETFCKRMLEGEIENYVADVAGDDRVHDLQFAKALGVGAWIGVPLQAPLGRLYILCCLARESRPLSERDVHVLRGLAVTLSTQLDEQA
jgi:hypothetical protein